MTLSDYLLYELSRHVPARMVHRYKDEALDNGDIGTDAHALAYARFQFNRKIRVGLGHKVWDLDVLELGAGHGGICCFMAVAGARSVTGIDVNTANLRVAEGFLAEVSSRLGVTTKLAVAFQEMRAEALAFPDACFDLVVADNLFEHVDNPLAVMRESHRVLRTNGTLLVPGFSSILSKNGLHLKYGLSLPWTNLFFSDRTIIRALRRLAATDPQMYVVYPGLRDECRSIKDVRRYKDLNAITYRQFRRCAREAGFRMDDFTIAASGYLGKVIGRIPVLRQSLLADVLSTGASAVLRKI